jgi:hypothetical protein
MMGRVIWAAHELFQLSTPDSRTSERSSRQVNANDRLRLLGRPGVPASKPNGWGHQQFVPLAYNLDNFRRTLPAPEPFGFGALARDGVSPGPAYVLLGLRLGQMNTLCFQNVKFE